MNPRQVQELFLDAVRATDRARVLDRADPAVRRRVEQLLQAHDRPANALDTPVFIGATRGEAASPASPMDLDAGALLGDRFRLIERLGRGGMGTVWRAEQTAPLCRSVAIKLIRPGFDSAAVLARFEAERAALARMDHPNIATVFDAGATPDGRPWFAMELVEGVTLTQYLAEHSLTLAERIELFLPVCRAIEHAHHKGIIHRDLKPSNVLITERDGRAVPVVIDFGVAKWSEPGEIAATAPGVLLGSFDTMAPEQLVGDATAIDTRIDVYALGALLYEIVSGVPPFDPDRLRRASLFDVATIIREETPPPPSRRAADRVPPELDWITLKCLEKDRSRRYSSAANLADDLSSFLDGRPVTAGPPHAGYRARKFIQRHRVLVGAVALGVASLCVAVVGTTWGMMRARAAESAALIDRDAAIAARRIAEEQSSRADNEAAVAKAVVQFLTSDILRQADTQYQAASRFDPEPNLTVRSALDRAAASVDRRFQDQPATEIAIRRTLGMAYVGLGDWAKATHQLRRALASAETTHGDAHDTTQQLRYDLGTVLRTTGQFDQAIPLLERAVAARTQTLGPDHRSTLAAVSQLAIALDKTGRDDEAGRLFRDVYDRVRATDAGPTATIAALNNLVSCDANRGRVDDAIRQLEEIHAQWSHQPELPQQADLALNLGQMYLRVRRFDDAVRVLDSGLQRAQQRLPADHPSLLSIAFSLAEAHLRAGRGEVAVPILESCRAAVVAQVGPVHLRSHVIHLKIAECHFVMGRRDRASAIASATLDKLQSQPGLRYVRASALITLARVYLVENRASEAEALAREAIDIAAIRRPDDWLQYEARVTLGRALQAQGRDSEAMPWLSEGLAGLRRHEHQLTTSARQLLD